MKVRLTVEESILLFGFLPQVGDFETLKEMMELRDLQMIFDERETREFDITRITTEDGRFQVTFNKEASEGYERELEIGPRMAAHITEELERLNDEKKLNEQILSLYEIFVLGVRDRKKLVSEQVKANQKEVSDAKNETGGESFVSAEEFKELKDSKSSKQSKSTNK